MASSTNECITVVVRCRPMNRKEMEENRKSIIDVDMENRQVSIHNPDSKEEGTKSFTFDATYDDKTQQRIFYEESCFNIVDSTLEGFNSTIFAYGQTGCGKSFTMQGPSTTDENLKGVIPNSFSHIFQFVKSTKDIEFLIRCSYLELYNEEIRDLLGNPKSNLKCELKEDPNKGVYVKNLTDVVVESPDDLYRMLDKGLHNRTTAATLMNAESSRSHSIFTIVIEMNTKDPESGKDMLRVGKLNLVDLAGSERAKKTGAKDAVLKEGIKINLSLSVLGNVISALAEGAKHIPYRDSKLTRLLQDSLGGNTKTMMVAAISPADYNYEETLSTLRYANRAKNIKNKPKINEDPKDALIREFKAEIERLRKLLEGHQASSAQLPTSLPYTQPPPHEQPREQSDGYQSVVRDTAPSIATQTHDSSVKSTSNNSHHHSPKGFSISEIVHSEEHLISAQEAIAEDDQEHMIQKKAVELTETTDNRVTVSQRAVAAAAAAVNEEDDDEMRYADDEFSSPGPLSTKKNTAEQPLTVESLETPRANLFDQRSPVQSEAEQQNMREHIANRLQQLEHLLVNHEEVLATSGNDFQQPLQQQSSDANTTSTIAQSTRSQATTQKSAALQEEEEIARQQYRERKLRAKKKREEKAQREMQRILEEKKQVEDELEELRQAAMQANNQSTNHTSNGNNSTDGNDQQMLKKINKMKKRYEKKIAATKEELEELREDFYYQRKQLVDAMTEQEKDMKLYEMICKAVLSEKEFKKIVERSRYDEDRDEWVLPFTKKKAVDSILLENGNDHLLAPRGAGVGAAGILPDIHSHNSVVTKQQNAINAAKSGSRGGNRSSSPKESNTGNNTWNPIPPNSNNMNPSNHTSNYYPRSRTGNRAVENNKSNTSGVNQVVGIASVPLLTLPGTLITSVADVMTNGNGSYGQRNDEYGDANDAEGEYGYYRLLSDRSNDGQHTANNDDQYPLPAKKNKKVKSKQSDKMPNIHQQHHQDNENDENTNPSGPVADWDFSVGNGKNKKKLPPTNAPELEYSDDEEFASQNNVEVKKKKKKKNNGASSSRRNDDEFSSYPSITGGNHNSLPPIDQKYQTPRLHGNVSLPPIG